MITHIQGKLVEKNPTDVVIDCNGVGYLLNISLHTFSQIPDQEALKLYSHLIVREDSHTLFGFSSIVEREIFRLLISVSGIGANTARTMLSSLTPQQVKEGIAHGDVALIQYEVSVNKNNTNKDEALSALEVLGFAKKQSERVVDKIVSQQPDATVETIIKEALKNL